MATKFLDADGGADTYTTWADWVSYMQSLAGLSSPEILEFTSAREFNGGNAQLTGGTVSATSTNYIEIRPAAGKGMGGDLTYGSGARTLFDAVGEELYINWPHTTVSGIAVRKTTGSTTVGIGMVSITNAITVHLNNVLADCRNNSVSVFDDRGSAAGTRQNLLSVRASGNASTFGYSISNVNKTYVNCGAVSLTLQSSGAGFRGYGASPTFINCYSFNYSTDFVNSYSTNSRGNASEKADGATGEAVPASGAVFSITSAEFNSSDFSTPDFRLASGGTKLLNGGINALGRTLDIYGQAVAASAVDIGPHEYQSAPPPPPPPPPAASNVYPYNPLGNLVVDLGGLRYY